MNLLGSLPPLAFPGPNSVQLESYAFGALPSATAAKGLLDTTALALFDAVALNPRPLPQGPGPVTLGGHALPFSLSDLAAAGR